MNSSQHLNPDLGSESYFYASHISNGCVPRFVVTLKMGIDEAVLRQTMDDIQPRFPQMSVRIVKSADGKNYHLEENHEPFPVFHDKGNTIRTMCSPETNDHLLAVTWYEKYLMFDLHHLLGDGTGFIIFINAVLFRYFQLLGLPLENDGSILTVDQPFDESEAEDPYRAVMDTPVPDLPDWYKKGREVFNVPCPTTDDDPAETVVQIRIPFDKFRTVFKRYESSPVTFLGPLFSHAIYEKYQDEIGDKCIVTSVPVNLRPYYPTPTLRYFITVAVLAHSELFLKEAFEDRLKTQKELLDIQTHKEFLTALAQRHISGMEKFRDLDMTVEQKYELMDKKVRTSMNDVTYVMTNMGKISVPESMQEYIQEYFPMLPTATCAFTIATTTWKNELMLSITQRNRETDVCERFVDMLRKMDVPAYISDVFMYHTMRCYPK